MRSAAMLRNRFSMTWRHAILVLALLALAAGPAIADGRVPCGQGLLWKVEHAGITPSYVFGTMHVNDPRVRNLPPPVRSAFNGADLAAFEVVFSDAVRKQIFQAKLLPEGRALDEILGQRLFDEVADLAAHTGIDRDRLRRMKPWAVLVSLYYPQGEIARFSVGELPLDVWMQTDAQSRGAAIFGLETAEEQLTIFDEIPEADQITMLRDSTATIRRIDEYIENMTQLYIAGDIGALYTQFFDEVAASNAAYARTFAVKLVNERNRKMVERMEDLLRQGGAFIAVGALHLPGEQGILRLLQRQGYGIVRVY